jgi:hypothetical protein
MAAVSRAEGEGEVTARRAEVEAEEAHPAHPAHPAHTVTPLLPEAVEEAAEEATAGVVVVSQHCEESFSISAN